MEKIKTLFIRDKEHPTYVTRNLEPECDWVINGEGEATIKVDGTNIRVTVEDGKVLYVEKRKNPSREEKALGAEPGYIDAFRSDPADKHIFAAVDATDFSSWKDGSWSCEAVGPKIQGGKGGKTPGIYPFVFAAEVVDVPDRTFDGIKEFLSKHEIEGIVWHHPDGRMAKIKRRDFGFPW